MPKMFTERLALNGATMGTRWSALIYPRAGLDGPALQAALAAAVAQVDQQMSTWKPDSDLNRLNAAAPGDWVALPAPLLEVLEAGLEIGRLSGGAFDIAMGDAVAAWGFGAEAAGEAQIAQAMARRRVPAPDVLELDRAQGRARKHAEARFDLNGIAKGYGVDCLSRVAEAFGIASALLAIDGELRAIGTRPDGTGWPVAVEAPLPGHRAAHSVLSLADAAVATSGDYRHFVEVNGRRLGHTMDPRTGAPCIASPVSVTVMARDCLSADAWATAFMVMPRGKAVEFATLNQISVLVMEADGTGFASGVFSQGALATGAFDQAAADRMA